jgi:hypothetical protein
MTQRKSQSPPANPGAPQFDWPVCYQAENWIEQQLAAFCKHSTFASQFVERLRHETGTLFIDWVDHLRVRPGPESVLRERGLVEDPSGETADNSTAWHHPQALLPRVIVDPRAPAAGVVAVRAESIIDFLEAHLLCSVAEGEPMSRYRRAVVAEENGGRVEVIERRAYRGFVPAPWKNEVARAIPLAQELWRLRPRLFDNDREGFQLTHALLDRVISLVGRDLACHLVFAEERRYWQSRNRAAQVQKQRQDRLGLGWANHDHHTFRSSRQHFVNLMKALEKLGFERRERYYAGAEAGWGAQISEHPIEGIVTFCDVDLAADETELDFSRQPLPPAKRLGTIGLWVGLHGESFLGAGLHHLECRFDYALLREQLAGLNVPTMKPFSDFPFLKQAFTEGERWPVGRERAELLLKNHLIDQTQFDRFMTEGAIGSHLENLQRKGGFKGFNQRSVSAIIQATDPRSTSTH